MATAYSIEEEQLSPAACFSLLAIVLLGTRFVQGFIFWGGASRRLIYDYQDTAGIDHALKLDFQSAGFVAGKLTHALPGTLWIQAPLEWALQYPDLIVLSVWFWTIAELLVGLFLIFGFVTRLAAFASIGLNVALMLIFGWMGSTCLDEWTMAVSGVAMSGAVYLAGGGRISLDNMVGRTDWAWRNGWANWLLSGPLPTRSARVGGALLAAFAVLFTVGSYNILFGAVVSPLHARVTFHKHHIALSNVVVSSDGGVTLDAYVDAGPDTGAAYIIDVRLIDAEGNAVSHWDGATLAALPDTSIQNLYPYVWASRFRTEKIGISGNTGAKARIVLPAAGSDASQPGRDLVLVLEAINGATWRAAASSGG
ncbi:TQO small subunit DoxD [Microbaculum marinum]|uniref:TQO small subunit DoxD n=1 Tax=Microbaculum marinum TaxID=1764581 RepID=A0AAW9RV75_9HYPH